MKKKLCWVRPDLWAKKLSPPFDDDKGGFIHKRGPFEYKWAEDDSQMFIKFQGRWRPVYSIDFEFSAPKEAQIIIVVEGGVIQNIVKRGVPKNVRIEVRDFDIEGVEMTQPFAKDGDGNEFIHSMW